MRKGAGGKRRDSNERPIIDALEAVGATVQQLSAPDVPDLLVAYRGANYLLEVKTPKGKLEPGQATWIRGWMADVHVVRSPEEALSSIGSNATRK